MMMLLKVDLENFGLSNSKKKYGTTWFALKKWTRFTLEFICLPKKLGLEWVFLSYYNFDGWKVRQVLYCKKILDRVERSNPMFHYASHES